MLLSCLYTLPYPPSPIGARSVWMPNCASSRNRLLGSASPSLARSLLLPASLLANFTYALLPTAAALAVTACGVHQDADGAGRAAERRLQLLRRLAALAVPRYLGTCD